MTETEPVMLAAIVAEHERPMMIAAAEQLSAAIAGTQGSPWPIRLRFLTPDDPLPPPDAIVVTSLAIDLANAWTPERRSTFWQALLVPPRPGRILLCTLFRHVSDRRNRPHLMERIRQLDLFAIRLSRESGIALIDLDRLFALKGADALAAGGAVPFGARAIAEAILADSLDRYLAPDTQQRAAAEIARLAISHQESIQKS